MSTIGSDEAGEKSSQQTATEAINSSNIVTSANYTTLAVTEEKLIRVLQDYNTILEELESTRNKLREARQELITKDNNSDLERSQYRSDIEKLQTMNSDLLMRNEELCSEHESYQMQSDTQMQYQTEQNQEFVNQMSSDMTTMADALDKERMRNHSLNLNLKHIQSQLSDLQSSFDTLSNEKLTLHDSYVHLQTKCEEVSQMNEQLALDKINQSTPVLSSSDRSTPKHPKHKRSASVTFTISPPFSDGDAADSETNTFELMRRISLRHRNLSQIYMNEDTLWDEQQQIIRVPSLKEENEDFETESLHIHGDKSSDMSGSEMSPLSAIDDNPAMDRQTSVMTTITNIDFKYPNWDRYELEQKYDQCLTQLSQLQTQLQTLLQKSTAANRVSSVDIMSLIGSIVLSFGIGSTVGRSLMQWVMKQRKKDENKAPIQRISSIVASKL